MSYRTRKPPIHTAAVCLHMPPEMRSIIEEYANRHHISLGDAGRSMLEAGAKALGFAVVS
ncbi:MAG: hypothetical protein FNP40_09240 [Dehalobacter sp. 4CP]|nr:hypothetical protein [Dehalobacter sp. 4CP]